MERVDAMELLNNVSTDTLKILVSVIAIVAGVGMYFVHERKFYWPAFEAAMVFVVANLAAVFYILSRPTDARWSVGKDPALIAPELPSGLIVGPLTDPLNHFLGGMTGSINDVVAIKNAFVVSQDFLLMAGWGLITSVVLYIFAQLASRVDYRHERRQQKKEIEALQKELDDIKQYVGYPSAD